MNVPLEVLLSTSIKRKKPCPRLCWLGRVKEAVFLVDGREVSEIRLRSGSVKKTLLKRQNVVTLATSGPWLAALHLSGELSLWNKDLDCLQTVPTNDVIAKEIASAQGSSLKLHLYVSDDGSRVLLAAHTGAVYLWENTEDKPTLVCQKKRVLPCRWSKIEHGDNVVFPGVTDKEATLHAIFIKNEVLGDRCLCTFVFYSGSRLVMTFLALRWHEKNEKLHSAAPYHVHWTQQDCSVTSIAPACTPVKSRGSLLALFSRDGLVLTVALNQKDPKETRVLYINTMNIITVCGSLRGCGSRDQQIPSRLLRSYWVADMSWTADSLFLACVLKRGSLLLLTRMGELLTLTTFGCSVEFGPAEFIPLHPFITYRPPVPVQDASNPNDSLGSVVSEADLMRQRYSVTCHPRLPYILVSDGYMVTALRFAENLSPQNFMKALLLDTAQRLENVRQSLRIGKSRNDGVTLRPLPSLQATLLKTPSTASNVPSFLQEEEEICGRLEKLLAQEDSEESDNPDYSKSAAPAGGTFSRAEHGRLEFASMFDTIHANDQHTEKSDVLNELLRIRRALLTAWAVGVSLGRVAQTGTLLHYTVGCLTHFMSILQNPKCPELKPDKPSKKAARGDPWPSYISIFHQCLTVLYWDTAPRQTVGHLLKLTTETVKLLLLQDRRRRSKSLLESYCLLKMVSRDLHAIYMSRLESAPPAEGDVALKTPMFEAIKQPVVGSLLQRVIQEPPNVEVVDAMKSERRLVVLWRILYNQTLCYQTRLRKRLSLRSAPEGQSEEKAVGFLLCHIQAELQSGGGDLSGSLSLLPVTGEEYFLLGSYKESVEFWRRELLEVASRGGRRSGLLQTRYYLALLYSHLYHYNLTDAQGMCDQLVRELLIRSNLLTETAEPRRIPGEITAGSSVAADPLTGGRGLLEQVHPDAALAVIRSLGRFMAAYFTNQPLYVFPPHSVCVLAPPHTCTDKLPRVVHLQRGIVGSVVRDQSLSSVWTVEYTLELLLVGGLISEAARLAKELGDWKMSVSMSVAYNLHRTSIAEQQKGDFPAMPLSLSLAHVFQERLQSFLGHPPPHPEAAERGRTEPKQFTDPIEEEDVDVLFSSVQEMLKAAVMADAEVLTETLHQLMASAKELGGKLSGLVPERLYLPAPPLYCPQPSSVSQEDPCDLLLESEKRNRQKLSGVLQRVLLLLRAARCSLPAAQWYLKQVKRARKIMQKIRAKASLPPLGSLPENLLNYIGSRTVLLKPGGEPMRDLGSCSVVVCFRELCALCWMLHVRERLSISCRQYQKARDDGRLFKSADEIDPCVVDRCFEALEWACRMLPFTRATNCEELIQDLILSLISELPPVKEVAEIVVRAFPNPEDIRVPLREKYHSVQQRLRHSKIRGPRGEEMMSVIIHDLQRLRVKALRRVQRNIGPVEMYLWEPPLDETLRDEPHCYDKYSLGTTSLSRSTLTDAGRPQIYSDADTVSDAASWNGAHDGVDSTLPLDGAVSTGKRGKAASKKRRPQRETHCESGPSPPKVGTWEFECNDEEYPRFLDLFLSYLLERDLLHSTDPGIPFLTAFSQQLREHELNSLVFDVHTSLKRKLVRAGIRSVFRAGSCFTPNSGGLGDSVDLEGASPEAPVTSEPPLTVCPTVILGKPLKKSSSTNLLPKRSVRSGLFGLQDDGGHKPMVHNGNLSYTSLPASSQYTYRLIQNKHCTPSEELGPELQAKYSNEAKLVEWMIRWSDRRLYWSAGKAELCHVPASTAIRVKTSAAALLTSIWLLEKPYLGNTYHQHIPPADYITAPVVQSDGNPKLRSKTSDADDEPERGSPYTVHEPEEENASVVSPAISRISSERSQESPAGLQEKSEEEEGTSVPCDNNQLDQSPAVSDIDDEEEETDAVRSVSVAVSVQPSFQEVENASCDSRDPQAPLIWETREESQLCEPPVYAGCSPPAPLSAGCSPPAPQAVPSAATLLPPPDPSANLPESTNRDGAQNLQAVTSSEAVRQLLQDEMFRLLQLQQINFMSLMQVVGSSFAAMPALQHILEQTSQMGRNPVMPPTGERPTLQVINPAPAGDAAAVPAMDAQRDAEVATTESSVSAAEETARSEPRNKEDLQNLPELSIPPSQGNTEGKLPAGRGLLGTAALRGLPLITPPSGPPKTPTLIRPPVIKSQHGFPLLKLQPEPQILALNVREAWAPPSCAQRMPASVSAHITPHTADGDPKSSQKWAEPLSGGRPIHPASQQPSPYTGGHIHQPALMKSIGRERSKAGIPLLHLRSDPVLYIPPVHNPGLQTPLLFLPKDLSMKPILLRTNLQTEQRPENPPRLGVNVHPSEDVAPGDSIKRKNRQTLKEKGEKTEKKASVTFRPEDSIIAPNNLDEVTRSEIVRPDKRDLEDGNEFVIPMGSFDSVLSHRIPETRISSTAELHFMASTKKRPPDIRDASTNTDAASKNLEDKRTEVEEFPRDPSAAVFPAPGPDESRKPLRPSADSPRSGVAVPRSFPDLTPHDIQAPMPPELYLNLLYSDDRPPQQPQREFRHHTDDEELSDSASRDVPSSAELHYMAAAITNVPPPEDLQGRDVLEGPQSVRWALGAADRVTHHVLATDLGLAPKVRTPRARSNEATSRLQEMDVQLQALQDMADGMEHDFSNTRLLVNTLETLASGLQGPKSAPPKDAGVPQRGTTLVFSDLQLEDLTEEDEYNVMSPQEILSRERPPVVRISSRGDGDLAAARRPWKNMDESRLVQDPLQMTGLSDIADILGDLLVGGVSAPELGLTPAQADTLSRARQRETSKRTPKERADLLRWMKTKQRERLAEHRRRLQELREQEHRPFQPQHTASTSAAIMEMQQGKDDRDRSQLWEHHSHRVSDAIGLMQEMLSESKRIPPAISQPIPARASVYRHKTPPKGARGAVRSLSANQEKRRASSRGGNSQPRPVSAAARTPMRGSATYVLPKSNGDPGVRTRSAHSYAVHRKFDPSLPSDRLSQITRRGMLAARNRLTVHSKNTQPVKATEKQTPRQDKSSKGTSPLSPHGERELEDHYERDTMSPWEIPDEINKILNSSRRNSILSEGSLINGGADSQNLTPDTSSESTGSILSKLDWRAIEDMVASVGSNEV